MKQMYHTAVLASLSAAIEGNNQSSSVFKSNAFLVIYMALSSLSSHTLNEIINIVSNDELIRDSVIKMRKNIPSSLKNDENILVFRVNFPELAIIAFETLCIDFNLTTKKYIEMTPETATNVLAYVKNVRS